MKKIFLLFFAIAMVFSVFSQGSSKLSVIVMPEATFPVGDSADIYNMGGGGNLAAELFLPASKHLFLKGNIGYLLFPTQAETTLSVASFGAGAGIIFRPADLISLRFSAGGGYYAGMYEGESGGDLFYTADALFSFVFSPSFSIGLGGGYRDFLALSSANSLYRGVGINIGSYYQLGGRGGGSGFEMDQIQIFPVFPVFYKYYDDNPLGNMSIKNNESVSLKDVEVSLFVEKYMDSPKVFASFNELKAGEEKIVPVYGLFNDQLLEITEATKVPAQLKVRYNIYGKNQTSEKTETVRVYDRNAMTWDDNRKAAAFVTAKDPEILGYSKNIAGNIRGDGSKAININFRLALGLLQSLKQYNINYVVDPQTPYAQFSKDALSLDYLQFPVQTMNYRAGDCDDLSILYSALLESVGIETAFITVPGHIFMAFALDMSMEEAGRIFADTRNLIFVNNKTWVPVEVTLMHSGFTKAWDEGAKQWRENFKLGQADLYPIHEAWEKYEPVGSPKTSSGIRVPEYRIFLESYRNELDRVVFREIQPRIASLQAEIEKSSGSPALLNKLGVLYARYGFYDRAEGEFKKILSKREYMPALVNMGNISYLRDDYTKALDYYSRAARKEPDNLTALLGMAKVSYDLEKYDTVQTAYTQIEKINPSLAGDYSYLVSKSESLGRASARDFKEKTLWDEE